MNFLKSLRVSRIKSNDLKALFKQLTPLLTRSEVKH